MGLAIKSVVEGAVFRDPRAVHDAGFDLVRKSPTIHPSIARDLLEIADQMVTLAGCITANIELAIYKWMTASHFASIDFGNNDHRISRLEWHFAPAQLINS